jgi:hypothetical protein
MATKGRDRALAELADETIFRRRRNHPETDDLLMGEQ